MDKEMCRGDTMLISIDAPTEYPVKQPNHHPHLTCGRGETLMTPEILTAVETS